MKKIICMIFVVLFVLTCCMVCANASSPKISAFAAEKDDKISEELSNKLTAMDDDDVIETWIEAYFTFYNDADLDAQTATICGFEQSEIETKEQADLYSSTRIHLFHEARHNKVMDIFEKAGIRYDDVVGGWAPDKVIEGWKCRFVLTKEQIDRAASVEEITSIDTYHGQDSPPDFYEPYSVPSEAPGNTIPVEEIFFEKMKEDNPYSVYHSWEFEELYTHIGKNNAVDWIMVNAIDLNAANPWTGFTVIGNRAIVMETFYPFEFGMAVYHVAEDHFYSLSSLTDYDQYPGLAEAVDTYGKGRLLGDLDRDNNISMLDVTLIQRCEANLRDYPTDDIIDPDKNINPIFNPLSYYSDFNRDGDRSILDVTCMQRYLAHMNYPIG
ncbi:hypothetical protein [Ruminococcus sp.]|uniref:hypothetical protein n=1 Tax=Ruminococcus sp. TaxID=41978 RepID=UPI00388FB664